MRYVDTMLSMIVQNLHALLHCSGARRKISNSDDRYIVRTAECNTRISLAELCAETINNISQLTLRHRLCESQISEWRPVHRLLINQKQTQQRMAWDNAHRHWTVTDWRIR